MNLLFIVPVETPTYILAVISGLLIDHWQQMEEESGGLSLLVKSEHNATYGLVVL